MITLKQLVEEQKLTGITDIQIIRTFLTENDLEEEGMDLIYELTKSKVEKLKHQQGIVQGWVSYLPSQYLYENYDLETAHRLHNLELDYLSYGCKLSDSRLKWAKENIPNIKEPVLYFQPLVKWLAERGIRFKDEEENEIIPLF